MSRRTWLPATMLVVGILLLAVSVATGESKLYLLVVIPVIQIGGWAGLVGVALVVAAVLVVAFGAFGDGAVSGLVLIGPIPIPIGEPRPWMLVVAVAVIAALALWLLLQYP